MDTGDLRALDRLAARRLGRLKLAWWLATPFRQLLWIWLQFTWMCLVFIFSGLLWIVSLPVRLYRGLVWLYEALTGPRATDEIQPMWDPPEEGQELAGIADGSDPEAAAEPVPPPAELGDARIATDYENYAAEAVRRSRATGASIAVAVDVTLAECGFVRDTPKWVDARRAVHALLHGFDLPPGAAAASFDPPPPPRA